MSGFFNIKRNFVVPLFLCSFSLTDCATWIGNPKQPDEKEGSKATINLEVGGDTQTNLAAVSIPVIDANGKAAGSITLDTAKVALERVKLKVINSDESVFEGPFVVDLLANTTSPEIGSIDVAGESLQDIELEIKKIDAEKTSVISQADPLNKNSIHLSGQYADAAGTAHEFSFVIALDERVTIAGFASKSKDIKLDTAETNSILLAFRLLKWFDFSSKSYNQERYDFSSLPQGDIKFNNESEGLVQKVRDIIKKNIHASARFGKDSDGNKKLEKTEDNDEND